MMHPLLQHKTLLLDLDGTMYRGDAVIPSAPLVYRCLTETADSVLFSDEQCHAYTCTESKEDGSDGLSRIA